MNQHSLALICVLAPLAGCAISLISFRRAHRVAAAIVLASGLSSLVSAVLLLLGSTPEPTAHMARWFTIDTTPIEFGLLLDGRTLIMGAVVALITFCVQLYSLSYMAHDPGKGRFFAFLALFEWSMLSFVYSASLLQTFIFWELVGLASFLLIGFWYEKPSAVAAAKKAFIMTRIGDIGLFIGLILLYQATGTLDILGISRLFDAVGVPAGLAPERVELIAFLLFVGVIGKSAQFPLHTWLPDAMEGPTPVSALLHSATMVAAGVFLVARFHGLFLDAPGTMSVILGIATFTAILASTMALVATDMKRVLAFSSISQLGFMLMGLAAGNLFAGFFHLTTHAFFKALLFLCAGAYIHHCGTNDMIAMGRAGAAAAMKITTIGLLIGGAALAGIPPLAGFFSKEHIIGSLHGPGMWVYQLGAYAAAFLTAYYTFRMVFFLVRPNRASEAVANEPAHHHGAGAHAHHGSPEPLPMVAPIMLLTVGALGAGFAGDWIAAQLGTGEMHHPTVGEMAPAVGVALLGVLLAWLDFGRAGAKQRGFVAAVPALQKVLEHRWYIDELYQRVFVRTAVGIARACFGAETRGLDRGLDGVAHATLQTGQEVARGHTGRLQIYVGSAVLVMAALAFMLVR